eukprot:1413497-Pyramimonas_sp.AAC.1
MEDNQAVCKVLKAGGSMELMHLPRTHRIDIAASSEQLTRGVVSLLRERTQNEAADIGRKRFTLFTLLPLSFGRSTDIKTIWHRRSLADSP